MNRQVGRHWLPVIVLWGMACVTLADESPVPADNSGDKVEDNSAAVAGADAAEAEGAKDPQHDPVPWNAEIEAVLAKKAPENLADLKLIQTQLQNVVAHITPATVAVQVGGAFGSAVIVSPDGLVLTAGHVVGKPKQPATFIFPDGSRAKGETLGMNRQIDSGMMRITDPGPWPYVNIADEKILRPGEWVVAIGHPGGFDGDRTPPVRLGRVLTADDEVIRTDCTLVGGDSGGPLFNMRGEVVGIHSRIGRSITTNYHVPISSYHATWDRLVSAERWGGPLGSDEPVESRAFLGVTGNPRAGRCEITQVFPGMPAARAGLVDGDVIRKFDGKNIESFDELSRLVLKQKPGDKVKIEVVRGEEPIELEVRLGLVARPLPGSAEPDSRRDSKQENE